MLERFWMFRLDPNPISKYPDPDPQPESQCPATQIGTVINEKNAVAFYEKCRKINILSSLSRKYREMQKFVEFSRHSYNILFRESQNFGYE